CSLYYSNHFVF
nr:immunoglobulin light chain junction region [Mus musculus]